MLKPLLFCFPLEVLWNGLFSNVSEPKTSVDYLYAVPFLKYICFRFCYGI